MKKLLIFAIAVVGLLACTEKNNPNDPRDKATISCDTDTIIAIESGGKFTVTISSKAEWSATANKSWVTVSPKSAQGDAFTTIDIAAGNKDEACVLFSNGESSAALVVYRENISCNPAIKEVNTTGEEFSVTIETHDSWTATSNKSWVTITPESGHGDAIINVNVSSGNYDEVACVTFNCATSSATLVIHQKIRNEGCLLPGKFSVSASKQVQFSQGNLQYQASTQTWRISEKQYDKIGQDNSNFSASYSGWIDLFGWGTGDNPTISGTDNNDYSTFVDWGVNAISNGGNEANLWRTLTKDEWEYLFYTRTNAARLFGLGRITGVNGTIILPDNWSILQGISFTPISTQFLVDQDNYYNSDKNDYTNNIYTADQWSVLESTGAVFLPAAGYRWGTHVNFAGAVGYYWSASPEDTSNAYYLYFHERALSLRSDRNRDNGQSVRLVKDVK